MYKIFFQESGNRVPVRERTKVTYMDAESVTAVRRKLQNKGYNIEYIQKLTGPFLEYEKESIAFAEALVHE